MRQVPTHDVSKQIEIPRARGSLVVLISAAALDVASFQTSAHAARRVVRGPMLRPLQRASGGPANLACPVQEAALSVQLLMIGVPTGLAVAGPG